MPPGVYGNPVVAVLGSRWLSWVIPDKGVPPILILSGLAATASSKAFQMRNDSSAIGVFDFVQTTDSVRIFSVDGAVTCLSQYTDVRPNADKVRSLGSSTLRRVNGFFSSHIRVGATPASSRPTAAAVGEGAFMIDQTLNKAIHVSNGGGRDAMGTPVQA